MIRYENHYDTNNDIDWVGVFLSAPKRKAGKIIRRDGGWQYFPQKESSGGEIFPTLRQCMRSLESE